MWKQLRLIIMFFVNSLVIVNPKTNAHGQKVPLKQIILRLGTTSKIHQSLISPNS